MKIKLLINLAKKTLIKKSPEILMGFGIAGMITTTVLAVKATPKAMTLLKKAEKKESKPAQIIEDVKVAGPAYIPAAVTGFVSIGCLIGSSVISAKRNAVLAAAYGISEMALKDYKDAALETVGDKKEKEIREAVCKKELKRHEESDLAENVILTTHGDTLCLDSLSGRFFKSDMQSIRAAVNDINEQLIGDMYVSLNEFYSLLDIPSIDIGNEIGWDVNRDGNVQVTFSSELTEKGTPCLVMSYLVAPRYDYAKLM